MEPTVSHHPPRLFPQHQSQTNLHIMYPFPRTSCTCAFCLSPVPTREACKTPGTTHQLCRLPRKPLRTKTHGVVNDNITTETPTSQNYGNTGSSCHFLPNTHKRIASPPPLPSTNTILGMKRARTASVTNVNSNNNSKNSTHRVMAAASRFNPRGRTELLAKVRRIRAAWVVETRNAK